MELLPNLFDGIGTIKGEIINLDVNPNAMPVVQLPRKVPQAIIEALKTELNRWSNNSGSNRTEMSIPWKNP